MGAGKPNFQKLYEMGKLPENQRHQIPALAQLDEKDKEIKTLKENRDNNNKTNTSAGNTDDSQGAANNPKETLSGKCLVEGCEYVAVGSEAQKASRLKLHKKSHNKTS